MKKSIKSIQRAIEKKRMKAEKICSWLTVKANELRDVLDELTCEEYSSTAGRALEKITVNVEYARAYSADMVACMFRAKTTFEEKKADSVDDSQ